MVIALALTIGTNMILRVSSLVMLMSVITIVVMTLAISALALGFGALFPKFDTENPAEIPTSFGGLVFMMVATTYLGIVVMLEALPVYAILRARQNGGSIHGGQVTMLVVCLCIVAGISAVATFLPLAAAVHRVEALDH
jgi:ABC-2 type transport system permease protein